ncbi:MAG: preprotein translocase subunit YajC [Eubacteriales bacterium]|jgi:preprotein translocase subunit YajC
MEQLLAFSPLILLIVLYYFLLIRPQKKRQKALDDMRNSLEAGDEVVTIGGFVGRVVNTKEDRVTIELGSDKTRVTIMRWGISSKNGDEA